MKKIVLFLLCFCFSTGLLAKEWHGEDSLNVYFFWAKRCPYCEKEREFLKKMQSKYPNMKINAFESRYNKQNRQLLDRLAEQIGFQVVGYPVVVISDKYFIGFGGRENTGAEIEKALFEAKSKHSPDFAYKILYGKEPTWNAPETKKSFQKNVLALSGCLFIILGVFYMKKYFME